MNYIKYPRTYHLPYSLTITEDDKRLESDNQFYQMNQIYCSIKMDGENTTVYSDGYIHARSLNGNKYPWQAWLKKYVQSWYKDIPKGWRICGENLYPAHSIHYVFPNEKYFFQVFGIYNERNEVLSYPDMLDWCNLLNLKFVDVFYIGRYNKDLIFQKFEEYKKNSVNEVEGFVVRNYDTFSYSEFKYNSGKFVRKNHIVTDSHWSEHWQPNKIE